MKQPGPPTLLGVLTAVLILCVGAFGLLTVENAVRTLTAGQFSWQVVAAAAALLGTALTAFVSLVVVIQQRSTATDVEKLKAQLDATKNAYRELFGAAAVYYYALQPLEVGRFDQPAVEAAHQGMILAARYLVSIPESDAALWVRIWQRANMLRGEALELVRWEDGKRQELWRREHQPPDGAPIPFGKMFAQFESSARQALRD